MEKSKLISILITGANKGIGNGIVKNLLEAQSKSSNWKYKIILTSRDESRGQEAMAEFNKTFGDIKEYLLYRQLDVTNEESINNAANWIKGEFGGIDILLNNAGVAFKGQVFDTSVFDTTFATNYYGTVNITEKFINENLIRENGKIIIVGSMAGKMRKLSENLFKEFQDRSMQVKQLDELATRFRNSIDKKTNIQDGWGSNIYAVSKMCINKYASIVGLRKNIIEKNIQVYSCCPGWVRTDMAGPKAPKSIEEGSVTPVYLVNLEHKVNMDLQGKFFEECKLSDLGI